MEAVEAVVAVEEPEEEPQRVLEWLLLVRVWARGEWELKIVVVVWMLLLVWVWARGGWVLKIAVVEWLLLLVWVRVREGSKVVVKELLEACNEPPRAPDMRL